MRFNKLFFAAAAVSAVFAGNDAQAQSSTREVIAAPANLPGQFQDAVLGTTQNFADQTASSDMQSAPQTAMPAYSNGVTEYAAPSYGTPMASSDSHSYGPMVMGQSNGCGGCCDRTPIVNTCQDYSPVQSCCGQLGPLGVPSLLTPARSYRPPMGRANGRPLFGQWQGF